MSDSSRSEQTSPDNRHEKVYGLRDTAIQHLMAERTAQVAARFFLPYLQPGIKLLDCGCGPGSITLDLAALIAPGHVTGIDISDSDIERARSLAAQRGVQNVTFQSASVYSLPFADHSFDAVYSNAVLEHLSQPLDALAEMRRVLKIGGVAGIRAADRDGYLGAPQDPRMEQYGELADLLRPPGSSASIGKHLRALLRQAGFSRVEASASFDSYGTPESIRKLGESLAATVLKPERVEKIVMNGWATLAELEDVALAYREWAVNPDAFFAQARCEAVGWNE